MSQDRNLASFILNDEDEKSLPKVLLAYKKEHDKDKANKRKDTSDFLAKLIKDCQSLYASVASTEEPISPSLSPAHISLVEYNFLLGLKLLLNAQKTLCDEGQEVDGSLFVINIINSLNYTLNKFENRTQLGKVKEFKKPLLSTEASRNKMSDGIKALTATINPYLLGTQTHPIPFFRLDDPVLQPLFDYCASKELDSNSNADKRKSVYKTLNEYLFAKSPENFLCLFTSITDGIQLSRSQGKDKNESRTSEFVLIAFRDALLEKVLAITDYFNHDQLTQILNAISFGGGGQKIDAEVSKHTLSLIKKIEALETQQKISDPKPYQRLVAHFARAILYIPDKLNKAKIDKAEECYKKGAFWATTLQALLADKNFPQGDLRNKAAVCAYVWNFYMSQLVSQGKNDVTLISLDYLDYEEISKNGFLLPELRTKAQQDAKDSVWLMRRDTIRANIAQCVVSAGEIGEKDAQELKQTLIQLNSRGSTQIAAQQSPLANLTSSPPPPGDMVLPPVAGLPTRYSTALPTRIAQESFGPGGPALLAAPSTPPPVPARSHNNDDASKPTGPGLSHTGENQ
jgi:hypothetical protein